MILPIYIYGHPVLRKMCDPITQDYPELDSLIKNMFETMYHANGVGLAAPQVGKPIRLFVVDASPFAEEEPELGGFKKVFINAQITDRTGEEWSMDEGCLSIPGLTAPVVREDEITITYRDENWEEHTDTFKGYAARIIQHEYDHIEGVLFPERCAPLRRRMLNNKLKKISKGVFEKNYKYVLGK
ncbi:peptide deformylase [Balneicella halophila]|uniref:Peptide deformylase n=1 Tax=Balneicella halophila TaxID=1537566 RepID=A0A7L4UQ70_BALHA|nr:peptide deformylase [Balneicella halophila]PVX50732.1 peptide deformylase [Balneicella halophila]